MAAIEHVVNKWSILFAVQTRLDEKRVNRYEALLARYALHSLFPRIHDATSPMILSSEDLWVQAVGYRLWSIIYSGVTLKLPADDEVYEVSDDEGWMAMWMTLKSTSQQVISEVGAAELLAWAHASPEGSSMAHTRFKIRGRLKHVVGTLPDTVTPDNFRVVLRATKDVEELHREMSLSPFEGLRGADPQSREEYTQLVAVIMQALIGLKLMLDMSMNSFRQGKSCFKLTGSLTSLRQSLSEAADGDSAQSMLLSWLEADKIRESREVEEFNAAQATNIA